MIWKWIVKVFGRSALITRPNPDVVVSSGFVFYQLIGTLDQIFDMPNQCPNARNGLLSEIAWLYLSLCGLSMTQNVQATVNQQLNSISNPQISTSSQGMHRSSNVHIVLQITTKGFSWSYGTQLWISTTIAARKLFPWSYLLLIQINRTANLMKMDRGHWKFTKEKQTDQITKTLENALCTCTCTNHFNINIYVICRPRSARTGKNCALKWS